MWICRVFLTQSYARFNNKSDFDLYLYSVPDRVNVIISNIITIYLGSKFVLILFTFTLHILYTSFSSFKYVYVFFNNNNHNIF